MRAWRPAVVAVALALAGSGCTTIVRSSVASDGTAANAAATTGPRAISDNGLYVIFESAASNLVPNDTNGIQDVFLHNNSTGRTTRVSVDDDEGQIPGPATTLPAVGLALAGQTLHVAFRTDAALEPEDTNGVADVYVRSVVAGTTERVSIRPDGGPILGGSPGAESIADAQISDDGRFVLIRHSRPGAGTVYLRDRDTDTTTVVAESAAGVVLNGGYVVQNHLCTGGPCPHRSTVVPIAGGPREEIDTNCGFDAFDAGGRYIVGRRFGVYPTFTCPAPTGLVRFDLTTKQFRKVPITGFDAATATISNTGRIVAAVAGGRVKIADLLTGVTQTVDTDAAGQRGSGQSFTAGVSGTGRYVVFTSDARLVADDADSRRAVFTRYSVQPGVSRVAPNRAPRGSSPVSLRVIGTEFLEGAAVSFSGPGIRLLAIDVVSPTEIRIDVAIDAAAPVGPRDVTVRNTGGFGHSDARCDACFIVT